MGISGPANTNAAVTATNTSGRYDSVRFMPRSCGIHPQRDRHPGAHELVDEKQRNYCEGTPVPLVLGNPDGFHDLKFRDVVSFEIDVDPGIKVFPTPRPDSRRISQGDFPEIIEAIKSENREKFGAGAGQPQRDAGASP